jgi:hypothetical protein
VRCGAIQSMANSASSLTVEHWEETGSIWRYVIKFPFCVGSNVPCTSISPPLVDNTYTVWDCTGEGSDQYRAVVYDIRIMDAFGQWSGWKTRTHPTWRGSFC